MKKTKLKHIFLSSFLPLLLLAATLQTGWGQCQNSTQYPSGSIAINTSGATVTISTCSFAGEYSVITGAVSGQTLRFNSSVSTDFITIRSGSFNGPVVAFGQSPLTFSNTFTGTLYAHWNNSSGCGTDTNCRTTTVQCVSCAGSSSCLNSTQYPSGSTAIDPGGATSTISTCSFAGEYSVITGAVSGQVLRFTSSGSTDVITIRSGTFNGPVVAEGSTPLQFTNTYTGTLFAHWNTPGCGSNTSCRTTTVQCVSCATFNPCASTPTILCGGSTTATTSGSGAWSPGSCGFSTPGQERVYVFTPINSGVHNLQVTSTNSGGYIDYFIKPVSGGCNAIGWACIDDIFSPSSVSMGSLIAGTSYYLLLDPETTSSVSQTFQINCPSTAPSCVASPTSPTNGQTNVCPSPTQTLSWPAAAGATSYDVYFGTTASPVFVANVVGTSYVASTPSNGLYYWQIRPANISGTASGCSVWSFNKTDVQPPTITCPASVTINNTTNFCSGVVAHGSISATDNCSAPALVLVSGPSAGSTQPVGVYPITYRATDASGNTATCSFTVTIRDVQPPTISCPANIVKNNDANFCFSVTTFNNPTFADNCGATLSQQSGLGSGASFPVGTTTNVFRAQDAAGNFATCSFTVKVNDAQPPVATCPPALTLPNNSGLCGRSVNWVGQAAASDNCGIVGNNSNNPGYFDVGSHTVVHTITDGAGNVTTCTQTVTINDTEYPNITCPSNITVSTDDFDCIATVNYSVDAGDNCPGLTVDYSEAPSSAFGIGNTTVTATATDASGNEVNCTFKIKVNPRTEICNDYDDDCDGLTDETDDWAFTAKLFAPNGAPNEQYGGAVDIDGDYAIASSLNAVHILKRNSNGWTSAAQLQAAGVVPGDEYGASVAIDGNLAAVGAPSTDGAAGDQGAVYVFAKDINDNWSLVKKIGASDASGDDRFGSSVAVDSFTLVVGAANNDQTAPNAGAAYVFYKDQVGVDSFGQVAKLLATTGNADDNMGISVAIDRDNVAVGATGVDGFYQNSGAAYIFSRNQNGPDAWGQVARMRSQQSKEDENFGASVGISGGWAVVGASNNDLQGDNAGAAFLFQKNLNGINDSWGQRNILYDFDGTDGENYGSSVGIERGYVVVGAKNDNPYGTGSGRVFVYERQPDDNWLLIDQPADAGGQTNDNLGADVAISGRSIIAGMPQDDNGTFANQGAVTFFEGICADELRQQSFDRNETVASNIHSYPVPFSDVLNIELEGIVSNNVQVQVINALGQLVADIHKGAVQSDMTLQWRPDANIADGMYFLRLRTEVKTTTQTIVLSRQR